jgi:hypothetical protein
VGANGEKSDALDGDVLQASSAVFKQWPGIEVPGFLIRHHTPPRRTGSKVKGRAPTDDDMKRFALERPAMAMGQRRNHLPREEEMRMNRVSNSGR